VQSQVPLMGEDKIQKLFRIKDGTVFEGKIFRGPIVKKDEEWVIVQTAPGGARHIYRRDQCLF